MQTKEEFKEYIKTFSDEELENQKNYYYSEYMFYECADRLWDEHKTYYYKDRYILTKIEQENRK